MGDKHKGRARRGHYGAGLLSVLGLALLAVSSQALEFNGSESAGNALIDNENDTLTFNDQSSAGTATIDNNTNGIVTFNDDSTAANSSITNINDATTVFFNQSTAGSATITNELDGSTEFNGSSTAGSATIINKNGGSTEFRDDSTAGDARLITEAGGSVSFLGTAEVSAGSIEGGGDFNLGSVFLRVGSNNLSTLLSGTLSGDYTGGMIKVGTGILSLSGSNDDVFNGTLRIEGGLVNFADASSLSGGAVILDGGGLQWATGNTDDISGRLDPLEDGGGVFDTNGNDVTLAFALSGSGALTKQGIGTLTLSGVNTYSGGTQVEAGTLRQGVAGGLVSNTAYTLNDGTLDLNDFALTMSALSGNGAISLGSALLTLDMASDGSYGGSIDGSGGLTKSGAGVLNLTSESSYSGATSVTGGTLLVNGSLSSAVQVGSGATLGGGGSVGGVTVDAGGILAPGNSIGTLFIDGDLSFDSASIYKVEVDDAGNTDNIIVSGQASLAGTVEVLASGGEYSLGTTYSILSSGSTLIGQFDAVTSNLAFLDPSLSYSSNEVFLTLLRNDITFTDLALTPNQLAFASSTSSLPPSDEVYRTLINLSINRVPAAYESLSGDAHASFVSALLLDDLGVPWMPLDNLHTNLSSPDQALPFWVQVQSGHQRSSDDGNAGLVILDHDGLLMGTDWPIFGTWRMGIALGYGDQQLGVSSRDSKAVADTYRSATYLGNQLPLPGGKLKFSAGATYSQHQMDGRRSVELVDGLERLASSYNVGIAQAFSELSFRTLESERGYAEPFARVVSIDQRSEGFRESGGSAALSAASQVNQLLSSTMGVRGQQKYRLLERELIVNGSLAWRQLQGDLRPEMELSLAEGQTFRVQGTRLPNSSLLLDLHADYALAPGVGLDIRYKGMTGSGSEGSAVSVSVRWRM